MLHRCSIKVERGGFASNTLFSDGGSHERVSLWVAPAAYPRDPRFEPASNVGRTALCLDDCTLHCAVEAAEETDLPVFEPMPRRSHPIDNKARLSGHGCGQKEIIDLFAVHRVIHRIVPMLLLQLRHSLLCEQMAQIK